MPKGPNGEWRPADSNSAAVMVAKIATGEIPEQFSKLSPEQKSANARKAAQARWNVAPSEGVEPST